MILFLNFAPLSFAGGAEKWIIDMATVLKKNEEVCLMEVDENIANIYSKLVLKRLFKSRNSIASSFDIQKISLSSFIPFTKSWHEIKSRMKDARIIYAKYELNEILLLFYFGGSNILTRTVIGTHSPLLYEHNRLTFFEKIHNTLYVSPMAISILSKTKLVHVLNDSQERVLRKLGLKNVLLIPNYIANKTNEPKKNNSRILRIGFLGELSWRKGIDVLLEVIHELSESKKFSFEIMGDGPGKSAILKLKNSFLKYYGFISHSEISQVLSKLDVLLLPSRAESFSLASLEAMSHGVIVTSSENSTPDSMRDLVEVNKTNSANEYILILKKMSALKEKNKLKNISKNVWKVTNSRVSKEKITKELVSKVFFVK